MISATWMFCPSICLYSNFWFVLSECKQNWTFLSPCMYRYLFKSNLLSAVGNQRKVQKPLCFLADEPKESGVDRTLAAAETDLVYQDASGGSWSTEGWVFSSVTPQPNIVTSVAQVCRECSAAVFTVSSVNWVGLKDFSNLHSSSDLDKGRMCCLQPFVSVELVVWVKRHWKGQWVTWFPEGV